VSSPHTPVERRNLQKKRRSLQKKRRRRFLSTARKMMAGFKDVLVVGDGDLSFAASLAEHVDDPANLTATVYESESEFLKRYGDSGSEMGITNMQHLRLYGCNVEFGVDATNIQLKDGEGQFRLFDAIIFNFPYPITWTKHTVMNESRKLMDAFLRCASQRIKEGGEVRTSLVNKQFSSWYVEQYASKYGLQLERSEPFHREMFKFYMNRYGDGREFTKGVHVGKQSDYIDTGRLHFFLTSSFAVFLFRRGMSPEVECCSPGMSGFSEPPRSS